LIRTRTLGRTGLTVSELALGGLFTSQYGGTPEQSKAAIRKAIDLGVNYIDTAPAYFDSEKVIGAALQGVTAPLIISTKLGGRPKPFNPRDKALLRSSVEESLANLGRSVIDILFIHEPDRPGQYDWWAGKPHRQAPVLELIDELKREGVIRFAGLGGTTAYEMARLVETDLFDVVLTAANYSLLWREAEIELLPATRKHNVGVVAGTPLQQGGLAARYDGEIVDGASPWLSKPRRDQFRAFYSFLDGVDIPLTELAHRFIISSPDIDCVLSGARSSAEIEQNVKAVEKGPLPAAIIGQIDEIAAMVPFRPYEEPVILPFGRAYGGPADLRY
jgi:aryl-alcohol dehydrogenase-like predicted oxidoreductase